MIPGVSLSASSAEVMNAWRCICISQYVFMPWCLSKQRDKFIFILSGHKLQPYHLNILYKMK